MYVMNNQDLQELLDRHNRSLASNRASTQRLRQKQGEEMGDDEYRKRERERMREYRARRDERLREAGLLPYFSMFWFRGARRGAASA